MRLNLQTLLEAYGIMPEGNNGFNSDVLKPKYCPNCNESNKPNARLCIKCTMILVYDDYKDTLERQKQKENVIQEMKEQMNDERRAEIDVRPPKKSV